MKQKLESYKRLERDLMRQIHLCNEYKKLIETTLRDLDRLYRSGSIDMHTYNTHASKFLQDKHPQQWHNAYDAHINKCQQTLSHCRAKIQEISSYLDSKRTLFSKTFFILAILFLVAGGATFFDISVPSITGFVSFDEPYSQEITNEDGFSKEGSHWMKINGDAVYERCLKVSAKGDFSAVKATGKIMSATDEKALVFKIYTHDWQNNIPQEMLDVCKVTNYEGIWKSCTINTGKQTNGDYWLCASASGGDPRETYYSIAYQVGDDKQTALWTGQNWQTLDRASYTIKAQFRG